MSIPLPLDALWRLINSSSAYSQSYWETVQLTLKSLQRNTASPVLFPLPRGISETVRVTSVLPLPSVRSRLTQSGQLSTLHSPSASMMSVLLVRLFNVLTVCGLTDRSPPTVIL